MLDVTFSLRVFIMSLRRLPNLKLLPALGVVVGLAVTGTVGYYLNEVRVARVETPGLVAQAWQRHDRRVTVADLSTERLNILLAIEDPLFFQHHGVDLATPGAGMTTVSQGLVKLLYFPDGFHQGIAKVRQTLIAQYAFDALVPKDEQLALLLNIAYLGHSNGGEIRGFPAAAQRYFGKEFSDLSDAEFTSLVAMLIAPNVYAPGSPAHTQRMRRIQAYLSGAYRPLCVLDTEYDGKTRGTVAEEALMAVLRIVTDASPRAKSS
jgi:membrane peptidoglycan carboxypeptidase